MNVIRGYVLPALFSICIAITAANAQPTATGTIVGRIYNPATREYVRDAQVRVVSTNTAVTSQSGGDYRLSNVPAGEAIVEVSFIGYETITASVSVTPGGTATRDFSLVAADAEKDSQGETIRLNAYVVSTEREGSAKAIMEQRGSMNMTNVIASDVFGDNAEGNVGEFLRNVPGITLDTILGEVRNVGLGGLGPEYTGVTLDGMSFAAADANTASGSGVNTRAATFEMFSLSSMDSLEVSRTISADMDANAPGGTINLRSKRAFDRNGRRVAWQVNGTLHSSEASFHKAYGPDDHHKGVKARPGGILEYSDVFLNNRLGVVFNLSESNMYQEADRLTVNFNRTPTATDPREQVPSSIVLLQAPRLTKRFATTFTADFKATDRLVLSLTGVYYYSELWNLQRTVTFNTGTRAAVIGQNPEFSFTTNSTSASVAVNPQAQSKMGHTVAVTPKFEYRLNDLVVDGALSYSTSTSWYETEARVGTIWQFASPSATNVNFQAERSADFLSTDWRITQMAGKDISSGTAFSMPSIIAEDDRTALGIFETGQLNATLQTQRILPVTWKAGIKFRGEDRKFENHYALHRRKFNGSTGTVANWADYPSPYPFALGTTGLSITSLSGGNIFLPDLAEVGGLYREHPDYFTNTSTATDYYNTYVVNRRRFHEDVSSAFIMATAKVGPAAVRVGVRREETKTDALETNPRSSAEVVAAGYPVSATSGVATTIEGINYQFLSRPRIHRRNEYGNNFPSASLKYPFTRNLDLQLGFSSTIRRPSYGDVAGVWVINDTSDTVTAPNVHLQPETARNYAARLAYYFKNVGQFSAGFYQNDVEKLIESSELTAQEFGYTGEEYSSYKFLSSTNSPGVVKVRSFELAYNQNLGLFGPLFRRLTVRANYTRSYANFIKTSLAPYAVNTGFDYTYRWFNFYANCNWTDNFPTSTTGLTYRRHRTQVDAGGGWKLTRNLSLAVSARNLLKAPFYTIQHVQPSPPTLYDYLEIGANFFVALKATY